ncbi:hypothetical protein DIPPA_27750 [Diplonema papillatum]|nr:hypothetical protein DIPPA_27750 [Diplonema papillatum]KAJ9469800.1 hypothetical protein DIPPA_27750 [Diplonema papillatum]KAJ9469801.1 hypothetical protein DIPPA_27750 [Diplonema papillatum]
MVTMRRRLVHPPERPASDDQNDDESVSAWQEGLRQPPPRKKSAHLRTAKPGARLPRAASGQQPRWREPLADDAAPARPRIAATRRASGGKPPGGTPPTLPAPMGCPSAANPCRKRRSSSACKERVTDLPSSSTPSARSGAQGEEPGPPRESGGGKPPSPSARASAAPAGASGGVAGAGGGSASDGEHAAPALQSGTGSNADPARKPLDNRTNWSSMSQPCNPLAKAKPSTEPIFSSRVDTDDVPRTTARAANHPETPPPATFTHTYSQGTSLAFQRLTPCAPPHASRPAAWGINPPCVAPRGFACPGAFGAAEGAAALRACRSARPLSPPPPDLPGQRRAGGLRGGEAAERAIKRLPPRPWPGSPDEVFRRGRSRSPAGGTLPRGEQNGGVPVVARPTHCTGNPHGDAEAAAAGRAGQRAVQCQLLYAGFAQKQQQQQQPSGSGQPPLFWPAPTGWRLPWDDEAASPASSGRLSPCRDGCAAPQTAVARTVDGWLKTLPPVQGPNPMQNPMVSFPGLAASDAPGQPSNRFVVSPPPPV